MIKEILYTNMLKGAGYTTGSLLTVGFTYCFYFVINIIIEKQKIKKNQNIESEKCDFLTLEPEVKIKQNEDKKYKKLFNY
jgi:hypothetical protein